VKAGVHLISGFFSVSGSLVSNSVNSIGSIKPAPCCSGVSSIFVSVCVSNFGYVLYTIL
jgi:hypothetical protein